jgi:ABC-type glycerol-3-phosphate transport system permease component
MASTTSTPADWRVRRRIRRTAARTFSYLFVSVLALVFAAPFIWMLSMSLQGPTQYTNYPPEWIPNPFIWKNYWNAMTYPQRPFHVFFRNSIWYTFVATLGTTLSSSFVAYGFARLSFRWRDGLFVLVLSTMMLPAQVTLIPQYIIFNKLNWIDSLKPLLIPTWFGSAFHIFLLRQFFLTIPRELDEAAILDGCDYFKIWWRIIMPLAKPAVVTVVAFNIVGTWNNFMGPLIYLNSTDKLTVAVGLSLFRQMAGGTGGVTPFGEIMAASVTTLLPMLILFLAAQRYFVTGIAMTGLKEG